MNLAILFGLLLSSVMVTAQQMTLEHSPKLGGERKIQAESEEADEAKTTTTTTSTPTTTTSTPTKTTTSTPKTTTTTTTTTPITDKAIVQAANEKAVAEMADDREVDEAESNRINKIIRAIRGNDRNCSKCRGKSGFCKCPGKKYEAEMADEAETDKVDNAKRSA